MRRRSALAFVALVVVVAFAFPPAPASGDASWVRPVAGRVVRPFRAPLTLYGSSHLGVDFAAVPGSPVRAAGAGTVVFAGVVAGVHHVVVRHAGGLRTSYSFLATIPVRVGDRMEPGEVLGTAGGRGENHDGEVLHLGLRIGATFVDPMGLFAASGLERRVHLSPLADEPQPSDPGHEVGEGAALTTGLAESGTPVTLPAPACNHWSALWCEWLAAGAVRPG